MSSIHQILCGSVVKRFFMIAMAAVALPVVALELPPLHLETVVSDLDRPTYLTHAGDERLYIVLQRGRVVVLDNGALLPEPFMDLGDRVGFNENARGLFSIAFHPDYPATPWVFANYSNLLGQSVTTRLTVVGGRADAASEVVLLAIDKVFLNHNGGQLHFGPDGYLYVSSGDSGSAFDPFCTSQADDSFDGKILRLDVDQNADTPPYYSIPADNPFVGAGPPLDEIWAKGLRNPWRTSFDRLTGDFYIADVGQNLREEVDVEPASSPGGRNYGWKMLEGTLCLGSSEGCPTALPACDFGGYTPPAFEYTHDETGHCSITGGYVYRGERLPELFGAYLYGDFCSGVVWAAIDEGDGWQSQQLPFTVPDLVSFGEDAAGEIYLLAAGTVYRLAGETSPGPCTPGATVLCLNDDRFRVTTTWRTPQGDQGVGQAVRLTDDSGYFWFFDDANVEVIVKVLRACFEPFNHYWVFASGLTNVEVRMTVTDLAMEEERVYDNPLGVAFQPIQDTTAFATCP